jgi:hypothetical protein
MSLDDARWIQLRGNGDELGRLGFVEGERDLPFPIKRAYFLYEIDQRQSRGAHAHRELRSLFLALHGSFDLVLDDGRSKQTFHLEDPRRGVLVPRMTWRDLHHFTPGSVCLVLASDWYNEADYFRSYEAFLAAVRAETADGKTPR